ncbi:MAG TPA: aldo/keto reductase [Azospirillaceae bacterium]|nr:aldo/keto reductase [Azospirillaceae bacterium]
MKSHFNRSSVSLRRLKTDYVDLLLIHWPNGAVPLAETLKAMEGLRQDGRARVIGVSNFSSALVKQAVEELGATLFCNQVEYHVLLSQKRLLDTMRAKGMILTAYSPLAQGRLPGHSTLQGVGRKYGKTAAQVALRWLIGQDKVAAIPRSTSEARAKANLEVFDFELAPEDMAAIDALQGNTRTINPTWAPEWDK